MQAPAETETKDKKGPVYTAEHPEYPKLLYNHEKRTAVEAKDKDDEGKKAKDGFVEEPYPPQDPESLTPDDVKQLEALLHKAAAALAKLGALQGTSAGKGDDGKDPAKPATTAKK